MESEIWIIIESETIIFYHVGGQYSFIMADFYFEYFIDDPFAEKIIGRGGKISHFTHLNTGKIIRN